MDLREAFLLDCNKSLKKKKCNSCLGNLLLVIQEAKKENLEIIEKYAKVIIKMNDDKEEQLCKCVWFDENIRKFIPTEIIIKI